MKFIKILIFDIDGVLVYVGDSYRKAIVETVQYYFSGLTGLGLRDYLISLKDTQDFKLAGGFNDDWELTYAVVLCYLAKLISEFEKHAIETKLHIENPKNFDDMIENLRKIGGSDINNGNLKLDLGTITAKIKENNGGIDGTEKTLREIFGKNIETARKFFFPDLIKRIFQEFYLGEVFFEEKYRERPIFIHSPGFIRNEKALINGETLEKLSRNYYLGIVTGRERFESEKSMKIHEFEKFFSADVIITREDTTVRKPDPSALLECRRRICRKYKLDEYAKAAYAGDIPDDIMAARNAGFYSIGCLSAVLNPDEKERLRKEFRNSDCDLVLDSADEWGIFC